MKKISLTVLFTFFTIIIYSQTNFGIKTGLSIATIKATFNQFDVSSRGKTGFTIGGFALHPIGKDLFLQSEILFNQFSGDFKFPAPVNTLTTNFHYLSLPITLRYKFPGLGIYGGLQYSLLLSAKTTMNGQTESDETFKSSDFSFLIGLDYIVAKNILIAGRYQTSLGNIAKDNPSFNGLNMKINAVSFTVGYIFK